MVAFQKAMPFFTNEMKKGSTIFLRGVIAVIGLAVLALCIFGLPVIGREVFEYIYEFAYLKYPFLISLYITALAFFFALYQTFKLLNYIDKNTAFSELTIQALKKIKYSAIVMSALYLLNMPIVFLLADKDDAPGGVIIGMVFALSPLVVAVFAAVLQKLVQNAIDIKSENELTV